MNHNDLANKWRPQNFKDLYGQNRALYFLKKSIIKKNIHHSYLISGSHGIGKTSIARIFAKCINCKKGISLNPCEKCISCIEINNGKNIDVIEIDAASKTKIEDIREIINSTKYMPHYSTNKIYIIDEVHMLSINSFNALLKTLEEPPENTKFILITTDINKIPATITSRCIQIELRKISKKNLIKRIKYICKNEDLKYEEKALHSIINFSDESIRDCINIIEKFVSQNKKNINENTVKKILGINSKFNITSIIKLIEQKNYRKILKITNKLNKENMDFEKIIKQIQIILRKKIIKKILKKKPNIKKLQKIYKNMLMNKLYLQNSPNKKIGFEMLILKIINN